MDIAYRILTKVNIEHEFNSKPGFRFVKAYISQREAGNLLNLGLIFKPTASGFIILYDFNQFNRSEFLRKNKEYTNLQFGDIGGNSPVLEEAFLTSNSDAVKRTSVEVQLMLNDPSFFNYTGGSDSEDNNHFTDVNRSVFYFTNKIDAVNEPYLHTQKTVGFADFRQLKRPEEQTINQAAGEQGASGSAFNYEKNYPDVFTSKPFGIIKLKLLPDLKESYVIRFGTKICYWKYILTPGFVKKLKAFERLAIPNLAIINNDDQEAFSRADTILFKGEEAMVFTSLKPSAPVWHANNEFRLVDMTETPGSKYRTIIEQLPIPDVNSISGFPGKDGEAGDQRIFFEIFI